MQVGAIVAERFQIEGHVASGGMGHVYRALDRETSSIVALKLLQAAAPGERAEDSTAGPGQPAGAPPRSVRFRREGEALAALSHPRIVRYVAHGEMATGEP